MSRLNQRPKQSIITITEIKLKRKQFDVLATKYLDWKPQEMFDYYAGKVHGSILLSESLFTTREDQPDFQYLVDLGVKALESGMTL